MKALIIIGITLALQGCFQTINAYDMRVADDFCKDKGGVIYYASYFDASVIAACEDGDRVNVSKWAKEMLMRDTE